MRKQLTFLAVLVTAPLSTAVLLPARPAAADPPATVCTDVHLGDLGDLGGTGSDDAGPDDADLDELHLRAPVGMRAEQTVTVDETCTAHAGPVRIVPVRSIPGRPRTSSEMYDCCGILMNAVYTGEVDGRMDVRTHANREPWNAGWAVAANSTAGVAHHVEFSYQGVFDPTGTWFYNVHDSEVTGTAAGYASPPGTGLWAGSGYAAAADPCRSQRTSQASPRWRRPIPAAPAPPGRDRPAWSRLGWPRPARAPLGGAAGVTAARRSHQRVQRGGQRGAALRVQLAAHQHHAITRRQGERPPREVDLRVGLAAVRVHVHQHPGTHAAQPLRHIHRPDRDQRRLRRRGVRHTDPLGQPHHLINMPGRHRPRRRRARQRRQPGQQPGPLDLPARRRPGQPARASNPATRHSTERMYEG